MGSSLNNSNNDFSQDVYAPDPKPFDVVCPQLPGKKPNVYQSACDIRLAMRKIPKGCRTCKGIVVKPKVSSAVRSRGFTVITPALTLCKCGNVKEKGFTYCPKCKEEREVYRKQQRLDWNIANTSLDVKHCAKCNEEMSAKKYKYCPTCRPIARKENKKRNADRQNELRKQQRDMKDGNNNRR